jgi:hypothetical protein
MRHYVSVAISVSITVAASFSVAVSVAVSVAISVAISVSRIIEGSIERRAAGACELRATREQERGDEHEARDGAFDGENVSLEVHSQRGHRAASWSKRTLCSRRKVRM